MRRLMLCASLVAGLWATPAVPQDEMFSDALFRRCIAWLMTGTGGALIDNLCRADYGIPPPSIFICARKVEEGFVSAVDREGCAVLFDDQAAKIRAGHIR